MSPGGALSYCGGCSPRRSPGDKKHGSAAARAVCGRISPGSCSPGGREMPREGGLRVTDARHCLEKGGKKIQHGGEVFLLVPFLLLFPPGNGERWLGKGIFVGLARRGFPPLSPGMVIELKSTRFLLWFGRCD